jgi:hypothetical protein
MLARFMSKLLGWFNCVCFLDTGSSRGGESQSHRLWRDRQGSGGESERNHHINGWVLVHV